MAAEQGGADRVELCDNLYEGGTTPSYGCIQLTREKISIGLNVIIRPRGGDFLYSDLEFEIMKRDVTTTKALGADGIVFGILHADGSVDMKRSEEIVNLARPLPVTFHRAFDMTSDPLQALEDLIALGMDRVLTSGQENKAIDGIELIADLNRLAAGRIVIMPGSGVNERNLAELIRKTQAKEFHVTGRKSVESEMIFHNKKVRMGGNAGIPEYERMVTDVKKIRRITEIAGTIG
jgi:copper homeostasis protein